METYTKTTDGKIEVSTTIPEEIIPSRVEKKQYDISFLKEQKIQLENDLANIVARHSSELAVAQANLTEVNNLLLEAGKLGVV